MDWTGATISIVAVVGGVVGFVSGLFGVGGGFLLVPVVNALLGVPMPIAVGSTASYSLGQATTAMLARRPTSGFVQLPLIIAGGLLGGVFIGTECLHTLESAGHVSLAGRSLPAVDVIVLTGYAMLLAVICCTSSLDAWRHVESGRHHRRGLLAGLMIPPVAQIPDLRPARYSIPVVAMLGVIIGLLSGLLGMSGGLVLIPAAVFLLGLRVHDASTMTIVIVWIVSLQSSAIHALRSNVDLWLVAALLVSGAVGARLGAEIGIRLPARSLKVGFAALVFVALGIVVARMCTLWTQGSSVM